MLCVRHVDRQRVEPELVTDADLGDVRETSPPQLPAAADRHDNGQRAAEQIERAGVEMIMVEVRDESCVQLAERTRLCLPGDSAEMNNPVPQYGVSQQAYAVELQQDRAVSDPGDPQHARVVCRRPDVSSGASRHLSSKPQPEGRIVIPIERITRGP